MLESTIWLNPSEYDEVNFMFLRKFVHIWELQYYIPR